MNFHTQTTLRSYQNSLQKSTTNLTKDIHGPIKYTWLFFPAKIKSPAGIQVSDKVLEGMNMLKHSMVMYIDIWVIISTTGAIIAGKHAGSA